MKKMILLIQLMLASVFIVQAQSTLNACGNTAIIGGNELEWSVGEMTMVSTFTAPGIIVTQGVLQPSNHDGLGINKYEALSKQLEVFPNPATSVVNIRYSGSATGTFTYQLRDMSGKSIAKQTTTLTPGNNVQQVNIAALPCATYMLEVMIGSGDESTTSVPYKIQKIK
ncbi:MAG: hypothetical protein JWQ38_578 [Flavipsychrobacter sp.]|nr:hypothetical protein [Flavipsychrobacter sp.]